MFYKTFQDFVMFLTYFSLIYSGWPLLLLPQLEISGHITA